MLFQLKCWIMFSVHVEKQAWCRFRVWKLQLFIFYTNFCTPSKYGKLASCTFTFFFEFKMEKKSAQKSSLHYPPLKVIVLRPCNVFLWQLLRLHGCCSQIAKISLDSVLLLIGYSMPTWMSWKSGRISMILGRLDKLDSENNSINSNVNSNSVFFIFFNPSWSYWNLETTSQIYHKQMFLF